MCDHLFQPGEHVLLVREGCYSGHRETIPAVVRLVQDGRVRLGWVPENSPVERRAIAFTGPFRQRGGAPASRVSAFPDFEFVRVFIEPEAPR